ncbi:hypothetical protein Bca52824_019673 [Brassica carinata]|uniref:Seryl-tRNA synthetase n=1 Tax=Brassica carinata TaxID=52824 RepID=A0A8X7VS75_BRACI|nr:hypothetical protein Bca52824_019673 [Brassica carinata]
MDEWIHSSELPIRYAGYSSCFRKEAGSMKATTKLEDLRSDTVRKRKMSRKSSMFSERYICGILENYQRD